MRRRDGSLFTYQYDPLDRMTVKFVPDRTDIGIPQSATRDVYYSYDLMGNQTSVRFDSPAGEGLTFDYSSMGFPLSASSNMGGYTRTLTRAFEFDGRVSRVTYPDTRFIQYSTGPTGLVTGMGVNVGNQMFGISYDDFGRLTTRIAYAMPQSSMTQSYDPMGRLSGIAYDFDGTGSDINLAVTYNAASQIVTRSRSNDLFTYDGEVAVNRPYTVNGLNQYLTAGQPGQQATFTYDGNGNLAGDGTYTYAYDNENRLIGRSGGITLTYDPLGHLFSVAGPLGTTQFFYDSNNLVVEYDGSNNILRRFAYLRGNNSPSIWFDGATMSYPRYLYPDQAGSVIAVTQPSVGAMGINSYDNWGIPSTKTTGRFRFTGQMWLSEIGVYYARARMYSPSLGRFLQNDPVGYDNQVDLYAYAGNDPVNMMDATGTRTVLTGSNADRRAYIQFVQRVTGVQVSEGRGGVLSIARLPRELGPGGQDVVDAVNASDYTVTIAASRNQQPSVNGRPIRCSATIGATTASISRISKNSNGPIGRSRAVCWDTCSKSAGIWR